MYIRYKLFRTGDHSEEVFNAEMIEFIIENDDHLVMLDDIMASVLSRHIETLPEVKKYGIGYVGKMEIVNIEVTDKDIINLDEPKFRHYVSTINPDLNIIWSRTLNNTDIRNKPDKT